MKKKEGIRLWMMKKNQDKTGRKVIFTMKKRESLKSWKYAVPILILALALVTFLVQAPAYGAVSCSAKMDQTKDSDFDGFTDYQECYGFNLIDNSTFCGAAGCGGSTQKGQTVPARANRLDPNSKDLFVILVPASNSILTYYFGNNLMETLEYITNPIGQAASQGGLGLTVHFIGDFPDRQVTSASPQKAIRIGETLDMSDPLTLGISNYGTPNGIDFATIFTQRIVQFVNSLCANANCVDSTGLTNDELKKKYIKHVIAHEVGHVVLLTNVSNPDFGGYHYKTGTNVILDQSVYYTNKRGSVTYYIGTQYTTNDQSVFVVK
jgi:hypothetical protein